MFTLGDIGKPIRHEEIEPIREPLAVPVPEPEKV